MPGPHLPPSDAERWLSTGRLGIYTAATGGDLDRALELYDWNARATAACLHDIGHLEVLLRNRYDAHLTRHSPGWTSQYDALWTQTTGRPQTQTLQMKANAISKTSLFKAGRGGATTHGHIVANLTFGFWANLTLGERVDTIWTPILSPVFPGAARGPVHDSIRKLNIFRNRLAHWEPLFSATTGFMNQLDRIDELFFQLDPAIATWVGARSNVLRLVRTIPENVLGAQPTSYLGAH